MLASFDSIDGVKEHKETLVPNNEHHVCGDLEFSMSGYLLNDSKELRDEAHLDLPTENPILAFSFMTIWILGVTVNHIFAKLAFYNNPNLSNYDCLLFMGSAVFPTYLIANWAAGSSVNLLKLAPKAQGLIILGSAFAIINNFIVLWGISLVSITKSTLIFDLNPLFCIILAFILIGEPLDKINIIFAIGSFVGIYFLTLNKGGGEDKNALLGIILLVIAAWIHAIIMILLRTLNIYKVHYLLRPVYSGLALLSFSIFILIFFPEKSNFPNYAFLDVVYLGMSGVGIWIFIGPFSLAFRYGKASMLAPMMYVENVFTLLSDFFIFKYMFKLTDYIGMLIIAFCLIVPAIHKIKTEK